ncbi:MAG: UDP-N-acetylmuramate dehydrogenase [Clostridiales bacterium]|nr:UDP-N-acetylmuramate dehydrogenase [Candidatus Coliplasma equi]
MSYTVYENVSVAPFCSMKVGGVIKKISFPETRGDLISLLAEYKKSSEKYMVVGNMSNIVFSDGYHDISLIVTNRLRGVEFEDGKIKAYCGETLSALAVFAAEKSVGNFEFCYGIPGTVGGAVYMNGGAYGGEIADIFVKGEFVDENGDIVTLDKSAMDFGYRKSVLQQKDLILISAVFEGERGEESEIKAKMSDLLSRRKEKQPLEYPSCGSTFRRPEGNFAGALIEQCGLKGKSIGGAEVSEKHAGFIINKSNATAADVLSLVKFVSDTVFEKTGVRLEPEIRIIL